MAGFCTSAIFAGWLRLKRNLFLLIYIPLGILLFSWFFVSNHFDLNQIFSHNFIWGITGALIVSALVIRNVFQQPPSEKSRGPALLIDLLWPGIVYGLVDSLLLSVLPVLAIWQILSKSEWISGFPGKIGFAIIALIASLFITTAYHWGYPEFRSKKVFWAMFGNGVLSLAFILTMNPFAAILPHIGMHVAAMLHGPKTTGQVPPHYDNLNQI